MALRQKTPVTLNGENNVRHEKRPELKSTSRASQQIQQISPIIQRIESAQEAIFQQLEQIQAKREHLQNLLDELRESYGNEELDDTTDDDDSGSSSDEGDDPMQ